MGNIDEIKNLLQQNQYAKAADELINNYNEKVSLIGVLYKELDEKIKTNFIIAYMEKLKASKKINNIDRINMQSNLIDNLLSEEIYDKNIYRLIDNLSNNKNELNEEEELIQSLSKCLLINHGEVLDSIEVIKVGSTSKRENVAIVLLKCLREHKSIEVQIRKNIFNFIKKLGLEKKIIEEKSKEILSKNRAINKLSKHNNGEPQKENTSKDQSLKEKPSEKSKSEHIYQKIHHIEECIKDIKNIVNEELEIKNQEEMDNLKNQIYVLSQINNDLKNKSSKLEIKNKELEEINKQLIFEKQQNKNKVDELLKINQETQNKIEILEEDNKKLGNINIREANAELNIFKNKLSSRLKFYYGEFNDAKSYIENLEDKAMCLEDHLTNIFNDIQKMGVNID